MPSEKEIKDALATAFIIETGAYASYITSRNAVDRTRFLGGSHFERSLFRAIQILSDGCSRQEQDELILRLAAEQRRAQQPTTPSSRSANTLALLQQLKDSLKDAK